MYYLIYKTTNKMNGKYYIGAHKTKNKNDEYLGSGVALKQAIKKYGKENFVKEILYECSSEEEMFQLEENLVDFIDENSYNMRRGGKGGFDHIDNSGDKNCMKNPDVVRKVIKTSRKRGSYTTENRKQHQKIITKKAAEKAKGKKRPEHSQFMSNWSKKHWNENKELMRDRLSSTFEITSPKGLVYTTNRLQNFCEEYDLTYTSIWKSSETGKTIKKGKAKGWSCKIIQK